MKSLRRLLCFICMLLACHQAYSQHEDDSESDEITHLKKNRHRNRIAFFTGTSLVPTELGHTGREEILYVPTYGIEYERAIAGWFGIGIHNELELQNYIIVDADENHINRSYVMVSAIILYFEPIDHLALFVGAGYEFTTEHNFSVIKIGAEYVIHLNKGWDIAPEIYLDHVSNLYTTYSFGLAIGMGF